MLQFTSENIRIYTSLAALGALTHCLHAVPHSLLIPKWLSGSSNAPISEIFGARSNFPKTSFDWRGHSMRNSCDLSKN